MADWQDIETAPKDGTVIMLYKPNERMVGAYTLSGYWSEEDEHWFSSGCQSLGYHSSVTDTPQGYPTLWQPLPPPPETVT